MVDVALILLILSCAAVEKLFKFPKIVVDVELMLLILNWPAVENELILEFNKNKLIPEAVKFPTTLNVDEHVEAPCNIDVPETNHFDKPVASQHKAQHRALGARKLGRHCGGEGTNL